MPNPNETSNAKYEEISEQFLDLILEVSIDEAKAILHMAKSFKDQLTAITPLLAAGIVGNINGVVAQAHENLRKEAEALGLDDPSTDEGFV